MTEVEAPQAPPAPVEFVRPRSAESVRGAARLRAAILLFAACWCLAAAAAGRPLEGGLAALFWLELFGVTVCMLRVTGGVSTDPAVIARVTPALQELCARAGCPVPRVMLRDDALRAAGVRPARPRPLLILSVPYLARIGEAELRGLLAHEMSHVAAGDLARLRLRRTAAVAIGTLAGAAWGGLSKDPLTGPLLLAGLTAAVMLIAAATAPLNRPRERRADEQGARLCGDPLALAAALRVAVAMSKETRARAFRPAAVRVLLAPVTLRRRTHPPLAERVARLEAMARAGAA